MRDRKEYMKQWYEKHKEEKREHSRQWNLNHKIEKAEYDKQYRKDNKEHYKQYRLDHKKERTEYNRRYNYEHKEESAKRNKKWRLNVAHGLTYKEWEGLWYAQDGRCAICDKFFAEQIDINVDHDHETGKIRGLLCRKCNYGLGYFDDSVELLEEATQYINFD